MFKVRVDSGHVSLGLEALINSGKMIHPVKRIGSGQVLVIHSEDVEEMEKILNKSIIPFYMVKA